ncbi:accessory factor UbiK family protein [Aureimonas mangrovi]|uniref:accessory factor UbiK family protein n=1 Tax=Aureimonas mangrovi TaxID=2758041 RepID=UPI00163D8B87|nr:accessory factor UbiK family protein [Aureimonas mangrovi]
MNNSRTPNRVLDEFARIFTDTAGAAQGVRREVETAIRSQTERVIHQLELVQREEFEVVREMAIRARAENEELKRRIAELEGRSHSSPVDPGAPASPAAPTL